MMARRHRIAAACLVLICAQNVLAQGWQDTPDGLQLANVGQALRLNGTPMEIHAFTTAVPMETIISRMQESWSHNGKDRGEIQRSKVGAWIVLNQTLGNAHRSFQIRETSSGQLDGFVALTSPTLTREPKLALPLPSDMRTLSIIDSGDQGKLAQQVIAVSPRSINATADAMEAALKAKGWQRHARQEKDGSIMLSADRAGQQFDVVLQAQKRGALVMMNTVLESK